MKTEVKEVREPIPTEPEMMAEISYLDNYNHRLPRNSNTTLMQMRLLRDIAESLRGIERGLYDH